MSKTQIDSNPSSSAESLNSLNHSHEADHDVDYDIEIDHDIDHIDTVNDVVDHTNDVIVSGTMTGVNSNIVSNKNEQPNQHADVDGDLDDDLEIDDADLDDDVDPFEDTETTQATSQRVNTICQTEECADIEGVNLKDMCDFESPDCYEHMKQFVANYEAADLSTDMQNVMTNIPDLVHIAKETEESKQIMHRFENLLMLKMFKRLKWLEKHSHDNKTETERYYKYQKMYTTNSNATSKKIHEFNIKSEKEKTDTQYTALVEQVLTPHKMSQELLTYELLHYRPDIKIIFNEENLETLANQIKFDLNRFNPIVQPYLEDHSWTINYKDTMNFQVGKNKIIFSNTINTDDHENNTLITHMDMMINFIKRRFKVPTLKYAIVEDNKYYFTWILISVGYYPKKVENVKSSSKSSEKKTDSVNSSTKSNAPAVQSVQKTGRNTVTSTVQNTVRVVANPSAKQTGTVLGGNAKVLDKKQQNTNPNVSNTTTSQGASNNGQKPGQAKISIAPPTQSQNTGHRRHRKR